MWVTDALFPPVLFESPARNQVEICKKEGRKGKGREGREGKGKGREGEGKGIHEMTQECKRHRVIN
jgi:hypothetical protein